VEDVVDGRAQERRLTACNGDVDSAPQHPYRPTRARPYSAEQRCVPRAMGVMKVGSAPRKQRSAVLSQETPR
jgi:hypothetical protein